MPEMKTTEDDAASSEADSQESSRAWGTTSFEPGGDVGLVAQHTVGLVERDNPSTREKLWSLVSNEAPLDDILDELSSTGLKALPDFGLAQVEGSAIRVVARGRVKISAALSSGSVHEIDPSGVRTWIEELVDDVAAITIALPTLDGDAAVASGDAFAVLAGSVPASSLERRYDAPDNLAAAATGGAGWTTGASDASMALEESASNEESASSQESATDEESAPADEPAPGDQSAADAPAPTPDIDLELVDDIDEPDAPAEAAGDNWFDEQAGESSAVIPPQPQMDDDDGVDEEEDVEAPPADPIDITADPVPGAAETADGPPVEAPPADPQPASPQPPPPVAAPSGPPPSGPGAGGPPPPAERPDATVIVGPDDGPTRGPVGSIFDDDFDDHAAGSTPMGDHDGMTAARADLADGGAAMPPSDAPTYGILAFSNGERINVDRAVLIGRNPKVAGAVEGGLPHIMKFDGPGQGLSRTHAEVRVEAGEVIVEDLQSTNGTEVQLPGQQRRRLRAGEPVVIVPGTLIDFGDELHCTLESAS